MPECATDHQMGKERDACLQPICAAISRREKQRQAEEARRQDQQMRESVIQSANIRLPWGLDNETTEEALTEVREALAELPEGTPRSKLEGIADRIIEQYKTDHEREENKRRPIEAGLRGSTPAC